MLEIQNVYQKLTSFLYNIIMYNLILLLTCIKRQKNIGLKMKKRGEKFW